MKKIIFIMLLLASWQVKAQTVLPLNKGNDTIRVSNILVDSSLKFPKRYADDSSFIAIDSNGKIYTVPNANLAIMDLQQVTNNGNTAIQNNGAISTYQEFGDDGKITLLGNKGANGDSVIMKLDVSNSMFVSKIVDTSKKVSNNFLLDRNGAKLESKNSNDGSVISLKVSNSDSDKMLQILDGRAIPKGLEYASDYSANYSNRSVVDKGYVQQAIADKVNNSQLTDYVTNSFLSTSNNLRVSRLLLGTDNNISGYAVNINAASLGYNHGIQISPAMSGVGVNILNAGYLNWGADGRIRMYAGGYVIQNGAGENLLIISPNGQITASNNMVVNGRIYTSQGLFIGSANHSVLISNNTASRNVSLPDKSGTIAFVDDVAKKVDTSTFNSTSLKVNRLLIGTDNNITTYAMNVNAESKGYNNGVQINPVPSGSALNILNDGYVTFGSTRCMLRGLPSGIHFSKPDYTILASITNQGALRTTKPSNAAVAGDIRFGSIVTGSNSQKYFEVEIGGVMHYVPAFSSLP